MKKEQQETEVYAAALPLSSAVRTGLEPATPCVTGMYSNQAELPHQDLDVLSLCFFQMALLSLAIGLFPDCDAKLGILFETTKFF